MAETDLKGLLRVIPRPAVILILGRRGSGKDVTAVALAEATGKPVYSDYDPDEFKLPKNWKRRWPGKHENDSVELISDAHLEYFSREWRQDLSSALVKIVSVSRHKNIDFIYTTQMSGLLDRQAVGNVDVVLFKEPSTLSDEFERPELSKMSREASEYFNQDYHTSLYQKWKWEHALAFTHVGTFGIRDIKKPSWWTEEMSRVYASGEPAKPSFWRRIF